jgi:hypothetical protein
MLSKLEVLIKKLKFYVKNQSFMLKNWIFQFYGHSQKNFNLTVISKTLKILIRKTSSKSLISKFYTYDFCLKRICCFLRLINCEWPMCYKLLGSLPLLNINVLMHIICDFFVILGKRTFQLNECFYLVLAIELTIIAF